MLFQSISRNSTLLALFALITTATIAGTYLSTKDRIAENIRASQERALLEIFPKETHDNEILNDTLDIADEELLGLRKKKQLFLAKKSGKTVGVILPLTAREGYTGDINLIVGIRKNGSIAGVRVLSHRETPGLGDKIEIKKSDWITRFNDKSLRIPKASSWAVKKDNGVFDSFTGATITPRAVIKSIKQSLLYVEQNSAQLFPTAATKVQER